MIEALLLAPPGDKTPESLFITGGGCGDTTVSLFSAMLTFLVAEFKPLLEEFFMADTGQSLASDLAKDDVELLMDSVVDNVLTMMSLKDGGGGVDISRTKSGGGGMVGEGDEGIITSTESFIL